MIYHKATYASLLREEDVRRMVNAAPAANANAKVGDMPEDGVVPASIVEEDRNRALLKYNSPSIIYQLKIFILPRTH